MWQSESPRLLWVATRNPRTPTQSYNLVNQHVSVLLTHRPTKPITIVIYPSDLHTALCPHTPLSEELMMQAPSLTISVGEVWIEFIQQAKAVLLSNKCQRARIMLRGDDQSRILIAINSPPGDDHKIAVPIQPCVTTASPRRASDEESHAKSTSGAESELRLPV